MGLSASNLRFLAVTARKADIIGQQTHCSTQKTALTREMQKVSRDYQDALNSKVLKWSNDNGVNYTDLSYDTLMRPCQANENRPYLITDTAGRVVVDNKYKKYAEMIGEKGNYAAVRGQILQELVGVKPGTLDRVESLHMQIYNKKVELDTFRKRPDPADKKEYPNLKQTGIEGLLAKLGSALPTSRGYTFEKGTNWKEAYEQNSLIDLVGNFTGNEVELVDFCYYGTHDIANILGTLCEKKTFSNGVTSPYGYFLNEEDQKAFELAIAQIVGDNDLHTNGILWDELEHEDGCIKVDQKKSNYSLAVREFVDLILGAYNNNGGDFKSINGEDSNAKDIIWYDTSTNDYKKYKEELARWENDYNNLLGEYNGLCDEQAQLLTSEQEQLIDFYDQLFTSIEEKGWVHNYQAKDNNYLNQMFLNNMYTITEVNREHFCEDKNDDGKINSRVDHYFVNNYNTEIATNNKKVFTVNDENAILEAQIEYEYEKSIINEKETRIDTRMATLQTELEAVNTMLKGLQSVEKENIERTMSLFT